MPGASRAGSRLVADAPRERSARVLDHVEALIASLSTDSDHRALLQVHVRVGRDLMAAQPDLAPVQLPLLVHAAAADGTRGSIVEDEGALAVAAACLLVYLGADLMDNIADDELPDEWRGRDGALASLAATTLLGPLALYALHGVERAGVPPERAWRVAAVLAEGLLEMSAGQRADLSMGLEPAPTLAHCRAVAELKTGGELALFARAAAAMNSDDEAVLAAYAGYGRALGAAMQVASDVADLLARDEPSHDLLNGTPTVPLVHALTKLRGSARERFARALVESRGDEAAHDEVRATLEAAGSLRYAALVVEVYRRRALACLAAAAPARAAGAELRALADSASLLPRRRPGLA